ncbi:MAG TPA: ATP-dependent helicase [Candidatus Agrococcus pullicola]|uniref:DNA 3'-5' helicase n=1 Tax=Candidatus Agrococcus pullicola TaxID=2838429 RepID=A0A9D1YW77_9MICO|nr:ATP-dependent helicase [Candidatus Agrococcus pullicola]
MLSPQEITERMNAVLPADEQLFPPSEEQFPVVTAAADRPALVVAGAGSGKTETMANRTLWLVANGSVSPEHVLGLTFTRKAAGELSNRFRERLTTLEAAGLSGFGAERIPPTVSTYNSFANEMFREFANLIGRSPDAEVLTETASRVLARDVVLASTDDRLAAFGSVNSVVKALIELAAGMGDNLLTTDQLRDYPEAFVQDLNRILLQDSKRKSAVEATQGLLENAQKFEALLDLVDSFEDRKRERNVVTFSDQVRLAIEVIERVPSVAREMRDRYRVILLDEYQDTSVMQVRLLSALFSGAGVMAVGDPNQSIYGWRGAAAGTLERFLDEFAGDSSDRFELSTSWRNDAAILAVANRIARAGDDVLQLTERADAGEGLVDRRFYELLTDEAEALAAWFSQHVTNSEAPPTAAMLMRSRTWLRAYTRALDAEGVDYTIIGGGGLLQQPAIVDIIAILRVLGRPDDGQSLLRILASARWRIGAADMAALVKFSRALAEKDAPPGTEAQSMRTTPEQLASVVDALDSLHLAEHLDLTTKEFSEAGLNRMLSLAAELRALRAVRHRPAAELIRTVVRSTGLDIELAANEHADQRVLDTFLDEVLLMQRTEPVFGLEELLAWVDIAEQDDRMELPPPEPTPGRVQIMTVHGAKGLEWDVVAIPALSIGSFPATSRDQSAGLTPSTVPHQFRGDRAALQIFDSAAAATPDDLEAALKEYRAANEQRRLAEERRIAYVGVTRARRKLWMSGSALAPEQTRAKKPSEFLTDAGPLERIAALHRGESGAGESIVEWPPRPFGGRVEAIRDAERRFAEAAPINDSGLTDHLDALLAERATETVAPLKRVGASKLLEWIDSPTLAEHERTRPMPSRRSARALLGTVFHQWTESRIAGGYDETLPGFELDDPGERSADLEKLQASYLRASRYARLELSGGVAEQQIDLRIAGITISCKIDAVFASGDRLLIVDWKIGRAPSGRNLERRSRQLSLYRIALSELTGTPLERIDAEFFFAEDGVTVPLEHPMSRNELENLILAAKGSDSDAQR